jgi:hypothetical protein
VGDRDGIGKDTPGRFGTPSPATVISLVALFVALSGTALALTRGEVKSKHIATNAVKSKHIAANAAGGGDVNEATLGQVPDAASADALAGLGLAEVTGDSRQIAATSGSNSIIACDNATGLIEDVVLTRPTRMLVFSSSTFNNSDPEVTRVDARVELLTSNTTTVIASTPEFSSPLNAANDAAYNVVSALRTSASATATEIPAGTYDLRTVLDSAPVCEGAPGYGPERLGYVTVGAR